MTKEKSEILYAMVNKPSTKRQIKGKYEKKEGEKNENSAQKPKTLFR